MVDQPNESTHRENDDISVKQIMLAQTCAMEQSKRLNLMLIVMAVALVIGYLLFTYQMEGVVGALEKQYMLVMNPMMSPQAGWLIPCLSFLGGLIASISPCIVAMAPISLAYIGTLEECGSRQVTIKNTTAFILGIVLILTLFGLVSAFAGFVAIEYRGFITVGVGLFSILLGLIFYGFFNFSVLDWLYQMPNLGNSFLVGMVFALVGSPCASPVLFQLLDFSDSTGNPVLRIATMTSYAFGYTFILFVAGMMAGVTKRFRILKDYSSLITQLSSMILMIVGIYYCWNGVSWFFK